MRSVFFVLMFLSSCATYGETCIGDEGARIERSKGLLNVVEFSAEFSRSEVDVTFSFPEEFENLRIDKIILAKIKPETGEMEFVFPLQTKPANGKAQTWYMLSENMARNNVIQATYGEPCGLLFQYQLDYKLGELKPH